MAPKHVTLFPHRPSVVDRMPAGIDTVGVGAALVVVLLVLVVLVVVMIGPAVVVELVEVVGGTMVVPFVPGPPG